MEIEILIVDSDSVPIVSDEELMFELIDGGRVLSCGALQENGIVRFEVAQRPTNSAAIRLARNLQQTE